MTRNAQIFAALAAVATIAALVWVFVAGDGDGGPGQAEQQAAVESEGGEPEEEAQDGASSTAPTEQSGESASDSESEPADGASADATDQAAAPESETAAQAPADATADAATGESGATDEAADGPKLIAPTFDVVRVEPNGDAVIAGRAMPGATVTILDNNAPLGEVEADGRGEWVFLPDERLAPGSHQLSLEAEKDGVVLLSENVAVIFVPQPQIAAADDGASGQAGTGETQTGQAETGQAQTGQADAGQSAAGQAASSGQASGEAGAQGETAAAPQDGVASSVQEPLAVLTSRDGSGGGTQILQSPAGQTAPGDLALQAVDYNAEGEITVSGQGAPGHSVIVYLDNDPIGQTQIGESGRWSVDGDEPVGYGLFTLRADQIDETGEVVARVETPFSRLEMQIADLPQDQFVVVEPGASLWVIARRLLGSGVNYSVIFEANQDQIRDPDLIYPGQIFLVPQDGATDG